MVTNTVEMCQSFGLQYNPAEHIGVECAWIQRMRMACREPNLHLYYHRVHHRWVVGVWLVKPRWEGGRGVLVELDAFDRSPMQPNSDAPSIWFMTMRIRPCKDLMRRLRQNVGAKLKERQQRRDEEIELRRDYVKLLRRKHFDDVARDIESGKIQVSSDRRLISEITGG